MFENMKVTHLKNSFFSFKTKINTGLYIVLLLQWTKMSKLKISSLFIYGPKFYQGTIQLHFIGNS